MDFDFYQRLADSALADCLLEPPLCERVLTDPTLDLLGLLNAAFAVRQRYFGKSVQVHILNNAQNGGCPEDCAYCSQARSSQAGIAAYPIKSEDEILEEARCAYEAGAYRYCMVFAGRGPDDPRVKQLAQLVGKIKRRYPIQVCISAGLLDIDQARILADAGLDRLNHNLNTSRKHYPSICTTHSFDDRLHTLEAARRAGLGICSGLIAGMGESPHDLVEVAATLRQLNCASIPVNFLLPFDGNRLETPRGLDPQYCLRILCLFRLTNPRAEIRCAAGREFHLRSMEVMCLYPANSLFLDGYLNARGALRQRTYQMIRDAGFEIDSQKDLDELAQQGPVDQEGETVSPEGGVTNPLKSLLQLRPVRNGAK